MKIKVLILYFLIGSFCFSQVESFTVNDINFKTFLQDNHPEIFINDSLLDVIACSNISNLDCSSMRLII